MKALNKIILLSALLGAGCAREKPAPAPAASSPNGASNLVKVEEVSSFRRAMQVVSESTLECRDLAACPAHVGLFLAADKAGGFSAGSDAVAACTAVLVGEDLALTNSHCIPSAVKLLPDLCAERVRLVLPAAGGHPEESLACSALLGHSERPTSMSPDLALLRLERKTKRSVPSLNRAGTPNAAALLSAKVDPDLKRLRGVLRTETCEAAAGSYRMPIYRDASSPALVLGDCTSVPGNSGSPLFSADGSLVGLLQASLPISEASRLAWGEHLENKEAGFAPLALGTSLVCLASAPPAWHWNPACAPVTEEDVALARPRIRQLLPALAPAAEALLAPFRAQTPLLAWQRTPVETRPLRHREALLPSCLASPPQGDSLPESSELELRLPQLTLELRFNRFLQPAAPSARLTGTETRKYTYSPRKAAEEKKLELVPQHKGDTIHLEACPDS